MKEFNTIKGRHFNIVDGAFELKGKDYYWHIPKALRGANIQKGDLVTVKRPGKYDKKIIVTDVLREDIEDTGKSYKPVISKLDKEAFLNRVRQFEQKRQSETSNESQPQN